MSVGDGGSYGILRTAKIKTFGNMGASLQHMFRERETPNADWEQLVDNRVLVGQDTSREVMARWHERAPEKIRSNAVHGLEYFVGGSPERMALMDRVEQDAYFGKALDWIKAKHGAENVLSAVIHRDETTPHMTVMTIPLDAAGKLNARSFVGNRKQLSEMQTEFAEKVSQDFGLQRGIKGSVATHERVRRVYGAYTGETASLELPERAKGSFLSRGENDGQLAATGLRGGPGRADGGRAAPPPGSAQGEDGSGPIRNQPRDLAGTRRDGRSGAVRREGGRTLPVRCLDPGGPRDGRQCRTGSLWADRGTDCRGRSVSGPAPAYPPPL